jgi:hypothetical protein
MVPNRFNGCRRKGVGNNSARVVALGDHVDVLGGVRMAKAAESRPYRLGASGQGVTKERRLRRIPVRWR